MAVTLVRHTTPDVPTGTCYGRTDLGLAASFASEAARVAAAVPRVDMILTSPLTRCRQLALHLQSQSALEMCPIEDWIEMDFGTWEGMLWADIPRDRLDAWAENFMHYSGHGGESVAMLETRVKRALDVTPDNALVVTHSGCIRAACAIYRLHDGWDTETEFGGMVTLS
ncbi:MAG TPA: alpha-ribazole phosphatase family protein [Marivita sp.]|nr:alpha-ribazole phosphatase family protein [Marivita sp.]